MKTPIDIRVTNLESSKAFEDKVRKLVNSQLEEEALLIEVERATVKKVRTSYFESVDLTVNGRTITLEASTTSQAYDYINHTEEPNRDYSNYLKRMILELLSKNSLEIESFLNIKK